MVKNNKKKRVSIKDSRKIGIYLRVSTRDQSENGYGLDAQEEKCLQYLKLYEYDTKNIVVYKEEGRSAKNLNRPVLQQMMQDVKESKLKMIVIYKLDRFARSVVDTYSLVYVLLDYDCQLIAVMDRFDINSANGRMILGIISVFAQWEREIISERTIDALEEMLRQGKYPFIAPFGWSKTDDKKLEINKKETQMILDLSEKIIQGMSINQSVSYLKEEYAMKRNDSIIKNWLLREMNIGLYTYRNMTYDNVVPAIMDEDYQNRIRESLSVHHFSDMDQYYLYQRVFCMCGRRCTQNVTQKVDKNYYYYYCKECKKRINQTAILRQILVSTVAHANQELLNNKAKKKKKLILRADKKMNELYATYLNGSITIDDYVKNMMMLREDKRKLEKQIQGMKIQTIDHFYALGNKARKEYIMSIVNKVVVDIDLKTVVKIEWISEGKKM
ncbi:recombinase family protein [Faecalicoccus pleomorphus]|uniref:recombinase family protein n=1 Tax=Faecalicoccus pleomorphus TaxID=1323 RepID=UPI0026F1A4F4|nr:recombinase family protein [Faecalicoccus pleomorphus]